MPLPLARTALLAAVVTLAFPAHADPIEPNADGTYCRVKSPAQQMKFTEGLPFRFLADGLDAAGYQWMSGRSVAATVRFYVDGTMVGSANQIADQINLFEVRLPGGLTAGPHTLTVQSSNYGG